MKRVSIKVFQKKVLERYKFHTLVCTVVCLRHVKTVFLTCKKRFYFVEGCDVASKTRVKVLAMDNMLTRFAKELEGVMALKTARETVGDIRGEVVVYGNPPHVDGQCFTEDDRHRATSRTRYSVPALDVTHPGRFY